MRSLEAVKQIGDADDYETMSYEKKGSYEYLHQTAAEMKNYVLKGTDLLLRPPPRIEGKSMHFSK